MVMTLAFTLLGKKFQKLLACDQAAEIKISS